ncbi:HIRAN domain-containing protein [Fervidibacillus halotolerans]|uniref:HIRAN domain-containing protein n=1 Tax=Fervidibacillus halotolerans TaxID=2980027 RepID=A0A9E8S0A1_9BACI|nr:HIRAN domain-containing protein [Fervidibacillus halotolerans]WAA14009.1 HIRAN domain-containing protein [Fervidibacillus halotolerans]
MSNRPFVLWLIWQNQETRQRYHIGTLSSLNGEYTFSYELSGKRRTLIEAMENGYRPHLAFRDVNKVYKSNRLFDAFARRLPDKRRPDFHELLESLGLPKDYTDMDLLRATGGRLATDPYEFVAPIYRYGNHFDFDFFIAGWRYYEGEKALRELKIGEEVRLERELKNPKDKKAVVILSTKSGSKLGYVPAFYSGFMFDVIEKQDQFYAKVEKINYNAKPQLKVVISVVGETTINEYEGSDFNIIERLEFV